MRKLKDNIILGIKLIFTVALVYFLAVFVDWDSIYNALLQAEAGYILIALILGVLNLLFQFIKWRIICRNYLGVNSNKVILKSLFYGFTAGLITPMRLGEYVGRALPIKNRDKTSVIFATGIDKFFFVFAIMITGLILGGKFVQHFFDSFDIAGFSVIAALLLLFIALLVLLLNKYSGKEFNFRGRRIDPFSKPRELIKSFKNLEFKFVLILFAVSFFIYLLLLLQFAALLAAFFRTDSLVDYILLGNIILFSKTILSPLSFVDMGLREGLSVYYSGLLGLSTAAAFNASVILFLMNLLIPSLIGLLLFAEKDK